MNAHDEMLDSVAAYALGALNADEARVIAAHMRICEECCAEYDALRPVVSAVGGAGESDAIPSPLLKARIMKEVRAQGSHPKRPAFARASYALPYALAAACLLLAAGLGTVIVEQHQTIAELSTARRVAFTQGEVLVADDRLYLVVHGLPALPPGKVYQTWTLAKGATTMTPSVTFTPDEHGSAVVAVPANGASTIATAISVEPAGGSQQPTTKPVAVIPIQSS
jgi:anti-sigma-K factor RskA